MIAAMKTAGLVYLVAAIIAFLTALFNKLTFAAINMSKKTKKVEKTNLAKIPASNAREA